MKQILVKFIFIISGLSIIAIWIGKIGFTTFLEYIRALNWGFGFVLLNSLGWYLLYTVAWHRYFDLKKTVFFFNLLKVKIVSESVNFMTPLSFVAGDPVRFAFTKRIIPSAHGFGSIIVDRTIHILATMLVNFLGLIVFFNMISDLPRSFLIAGYVFICAGLALNIVMIYYQREGQLTRLFAFIFKIKWIGKKYPNLKDKFSEIDSSTNTFFIRKPAAFWQSLILHIGGRILGVTEIAIIIYLLSGKLDLRFSLALATLTSLAHLVFAFVPACIGIIESIYAAIFYMFHADVGLGVTVQIIRRIRAIFWIMLSLMIVKYLNLSSGSLARDNLLCSFDGHAHNEQCI